MSRLSVGVGIDDAHKHLELSRGNISRAVTTSDRTVVRHMGGYFGGWLGWGRYWGAKPVIVVRLDDDPFQRLSRILGNVIAMWEDILNEATLAGAIPGTRPTN